jgi:hypothetical protein
MEHHKNLLAGGTFLLGYGAGFISALWFKGYPVVERR